MKYYLTHGRPDQGRCHAASSLAQGGTKGKATHFYFVPEGSSVPGQAEEGTTVDESAGAAAVA